ARGAQRSARSHGRGHGRHLGRGLIPPDFRSPDEVPAQRARNPGGRSRISLHSIRATEATMSRPTVGDRTRRLEDFSGTLILVGAGRMGGAMLEGWIALGIDPGKTVVLEPNPSPALMKLPGRGLPGDPDQPPAELRGLR